MPRDIQQPVRSESGEERHPAFAMISVSHVQHGPRGAVLFDSEVRHQDLVQLRISTASRKRSLHRDSVFADQRIIELDMSQAQWAAFVSSFGRGDGVPATMRFRFGEGQLPGLPYESRLAESAAEVRSAASDAMREVKRALQVYTEHKTASNLRTLQARIENLPSNLAFAAESLNEHTENVVQKARADIEAMFDRAAAQRGLEPGDYEVPQLVESTGEEVGHEDA